MYQTRQLLLYMYGSSRSVCTEMHLASHCCINTKDVVCFAACFRYLAHSSEQDDEDDADAIPGTPPD